MHNRLPRPQWLRRQIRDWITFFPKVSGTNPDVGTAEYPKCRPVCITDDVSFASVKWYDGFTLVSGWPSRYGIEAFFCGRVSTENGGWDNQWLSATVQFPEDNIAAKTEVASTISKCFGKQQMYLFIWNLQKVLKKNKARKARAVAGAYSEEVILLNNRTWVKLVLQSDNRLREDVLVAGGPLSCSARSYKLILRVFSNILVFTVTFAQARRKKNVTNSIKTLRSILEHFMLAGDQANFSFL